MPPNTLRKAIRSFNDIQPGRERRRRLKLFRDIFGLPLSEAKYLCQNIADYWEDYKLICAYAPTHQWTDDRSPLEIWVIQIRANDPSLVGTYDAFIRVLRHFMSKEKQGQTVTTMQESGYVQAKDLLRQELEKRHTHQYLPSTGKRRRARNANPLRDFVVDDTDTSMEDVHLTSSDEAQYTEDDMSGLEIVSGDDMSGLEFNSDSDMSGLEIVWNKTGFTDKGNQKRKVGSSGFSSGDSDSSESFDWNWSGEPSVGAKMPKALRKSQGRRVPTALKRDQRSSPNLPTTWEPSGDEHLVSQKYNINTGLQDLLVREVDRQSATGTEPREPHLATKASQRRAEARKRKKEKKKKAKRQTQVRLDLRHLPELKPIPEVDEWLLDAYRYAAEVFQRKADIILGSRPDLKPRSPSQDTSAVSRGSPHDSGTPRSPAFVGHDIRNFKISSRGTEPKRPKLGSGGFQTWKSEAQKKAEAVPQQDITLHRTLSEHPYNQISNSRSALKWDGIICPICLAQTNIVDASVRKIHLPGKPSGYDNVCPDCAEMIDDFASSDIDTIRLHTAAKHEAAIASAGECGFCRLKTTSFVGGIPPRPGIRKACHACLLYRTLHNTANPSVECTRCSASITTPFWARDSSGATCKPCNLRSNRLTILPTVPWGFLSDDARVNGISGAPRCLSCGTGDSVTRGGWTWDFHGQPQCVRCVDKYSRYSWLQGFLPEGQCSHCRLERAPYWHVVDGKMLCHWCFYPKGDVRRVRQPECRKCGTMQRTTWYHANLRNEKTGVARQRQLCRMCATSPVSLGFAFSAIEKLKPANIPAQNLKTRLLLRKRRRSETRRDTRRENPRMFLIF